MADIKKIKLILDTNIPGKEEIQFSPSMLYLPNGNVNIGNDLYFTNSVEYDYMKLKIMSYPDIISFFTNEELFKRKINAFSKPVEPNKVITTNKKNMKTMLSLLFPAEHEYASWVDDSYSIITKKSNLNLTTFFQKFQNKFTLKNNFKYSYLNIAGKKYTFNKTIWLNDLINHPKYRGFIVEYDKLRKLTNYKKNKSRTQKDSGEMNRSEFIELMNNKNDNESFERDARIFKTTQKDFIYPKRISDNFELQNILDNKEDYTKLDELFVNAYNSFIKNNENNFSLMNAEDKKLYRTGLNTIFTDTLNPYYEVHVLTDFIEGELNDSNSENFKCHLKDHYLGSQLDHYMINNWKDSTSLLYNNRAMLSITDLSSNNNVNNTVVNKNNEDMKINNYYNYQNEEGNFIRRPNIENNINIKELMNKLDDFILDISKKNNIELPKNIEKINNKYNVDILKELFTDKSSNFVNIIQNWLNNKMKFGNIEYLKKISEEFIKIKGYYKVVIDKNLLNINDANYDKEKKSFLIIDNEKAEIKIKIIDEILKDIQNEMKIIGGGGKNNGKKQSQSKKVRKNLSNRTKKFRIFLRFE
jgi:hypothetical protein